MGMYLNPGNMRFQISLNSEIYVDKTELILYTNTLVNTNQRYLCVSRPRRFGKSMAADMLCAYYGRGTGSRSLFERCQLACGSEKNNGTAWDQYLGQFHVIRLVMTDFFRKDKNVEAALRTMESRILEELEENFAGVVIEKDDFFYSFEKFYKKTGLQFVIVIDEWDAVFRECREDRDGQRAYLDFLRDWLKDKDSIALAYMTGILPIKKYGKYSALNMFDEYSMISPMQMAPYTGFTEEEVKELCRRYGRDFYKIREWYDGYQVSDIVPPDPDHEELRTTGRSPEAGKYALYSPLSVVKAMRSGEINNYWNETETYEALKQYIEWDFDGLREAVAILMEGSRIKADINGYQNDMTSFHSRDDILTMLVHLGYLGHDRCTGELFIPNKEVLQVFKSSTKGTEWGVTFRALDNSRKYSDPGTGFRQRLC